jgi:hypothetical protein
MEFLELKITTEMKNSPKGTQQHIRTEERVPELKDTYCMAPQCSVPHPAFSLVPDRTSQNQCLDRPGTGQLQAFLAGLSPSPGLTRLPLP